MNRRMVRTGPARGRTAARAARWNDRAVSAFRVALLAALLAAGAASGAELQAQRPRGAEAELAPRFFGGGNLMVASPRGEFRRYVGTGFGLSGHIMWQIDEGGVFGLRADGGFVNYGRETKTVPFSSTVGGRVTVDVTTTNNIAMLALGPQLMMPDGRLRPYANTGIGVAFFVTESSVRGTGNQTGEDFARTTNFDDASFAFSGGAGLYVPLRRGVTPISLDLGARYNLNGTARYLREGSIQDHPDGTISFTPIESETNLLNIYLGVSIGFGGASGAGGYR